jgi:hypothetical protein
MRQKRTLRCREQQELAHGDGGFRRRCPRWQKKKKTRRTSTVLKTFGFRFTVLGAATTKTGCTSETYASRRTSVCGFR